MDSNTILNTTVPIGLVLVFVQNWLKQQKWFPFIDYNSAKMNHLFSILSTGLATLGIHFTYSSADHTLLISGLAWSTVLTGAWHWLQQYAVTKGLYFGLSSTLNPKLVDGTLQVGAVSVSSSNLPKALDELQNRQQSGFDIK